MRRNGIARVVVDLFVMAGIGLALGLLGPFGTFPMPPALRITAWILFILVGYAAFRPMLLVGDALATLTGMPRVLAGLIACALAALPVSLFIRLGFGGWSLSALLGDPDFLTFYAEVLLVGLGVYGLMTLLFRRERVTASAPPPAPPPLAPAEPARDVEPGRAFLDRLPPNLGRDLLALEMEDHYLRAHTALGDTLLLMRMRDAETELNGLEGARTHRSWWVAKGAVRGVERDGRALRLRLANGLLVPVARDQAEPLRRAGWLDSRGAAA